MSSVSVGPEGWDRAFLPCRKETRPARFFAVSFSFALENCWLITGEDSGVDVPNRYEKERYLVLQDGKEGFAVPPGVSAPTSFGLGRPARRGASGL